tara:strand:+ start:71 stop:304 length:234 start_codon:yes stop_codon:yes gene_type:complete
MNNIFVVSAVISIIFLIAQFIEMRFIEKDNKPLKILIRDALLVYFSVISGYFILNQIEPALNESSKITPIFTDNPGF